MLQPCRSPQKAKLADNRKLTGRKLGVIVLQAREQVTVHVERYLNRGMSEQRLHPLRFDAMLEKATSLCGAAQGNLWAYANGSTRPQHMAARDSPSGYASAVPSRGPR